jgi:peroxiredoxin
VSTPRQIRREEAAARFPAVPLTIEGSAVLHQMFRVRWPEWRKLDARARSQIITEAVKLFERAPATSAMYSVLGHKGDLLLIHFRDTFDELNAIQQQLAKLRFFDYLEATTSYVSVIELGLYESTVKAYQSLAERGIEPHSPEWNKEIEDVVDRQREAMKARLYPEIPQAKYICFYPMDRRRGEDKNWYTLPLEERQRQMHEHGLVGRRYAGEVKQIISGSIGFDDWEWGVTLFADDALAFKRLIYEMRFDEVSAVYALFGTFYVGVRTPMKDLPSVLAI